MQLSRHTVAILGIACLLHAAPSAAQDGPQVTIGGTTYTKFLFGTQRDQGSLYNFTSVPGEGYGDNGQGSEVELMMNARLSSAVEVKARLHSRFSQNFWTNFGGFGGNAAGPCVAGNCGEFDPRSNQYVKLRGVAVTLTPGYAWLDQVNIGANDFGQFDPFVVGRIRYIDRDNAAGILIQGSLLNRKLKWDVAGIALPRLWAGPNYSTGTYHATDASYVAQARFTPSSVFDVSGLFNFINDAEIDVTDTNLDNGQTLRTRFRNAVGGLKAGLHVSPVIDIRGQFYYSAANSALDLAPKDFSGTSGFSPVPAGRHYDASMKGNIDINDPFGMGLSLFIEGFSIGADYVSLMAARRESDVLLTEGHDATFAYPGPNNASFGVFNGNPTRIGYGGWDGNAQQVATINVDNEFTDFDEPMAETVIGWKGLTFVPVYTRGPLDLSAEYSLIGYNTNWQAWGDDSRPVSSTLYPTNELDTGVGHNFRSAYAPFQDKLTHILLAKVKYTLDVGSGLELLGKVKYIAENDKRLNDPKYLPYASGDCLPNGGGCSNVVNTYNGTNSTADLYGNPNVITVDGAPGYQWKPFDNIADDDRELSYFTFNVGLGYQVTDDLYLNLGYAKYLADLKDGNTALQGYNLHEMASGFHDKNQLAVKGKYILAGIEIGAEYQYNWGTFTPDFGNGYTPTTADATIANDHHVAEGSPGFSGRFGGWNSLATRKFEQHRLKAFLKVQF